MMDEAEHHQGCLCPRYSPLPATGLVLPVSLPTAPLPTMAPGQSP